MGRLQRALAEEPSARFAVIFPSGGLNDVLCGLERAMRYCEASNRVLVIDSTFSHLPGRYLDTIFDLRRVHNIIYRLDSADQRALREESRVAEMAGNVLKLGLLARWTCEGRKKKSELSDSTLVILRGGNGGWIGHKFVRRVSFRKEILDLLADELALIGRNYAAVHLRSTDYESDFQGVLRWISRRFVDMPVVFATDSVDALLEARNFLGPRLIDFRRHLDPKGRPLHKTHGDSTTATEERIVRELVLDLLLISLAQRQVFTVSYGVWNSARPVLSGFFVLAASLSREPSIRAFRAKIMPSISQEKLPVRHLVVTPDQLATMVLRLRFLNFFRRPYSRLRKFWFSSDNRGF